MLLATPILRALGLISLARRPGKAQSERTASRPGLAVLLLLISVRLGFAQSSPSAAPPPATQADFARRAKKIFDESHARYHYDTNNVEAAWQFARACFDLADFKTRNSERADIAQQGIAAARQALARESNSAPAHYYLGMNLAQLAQTKMLGALKIVNQMEREFTIVRGLDEKLDEA